MPFRIQSIAEARYQPPWRRWVVGTIAALGATWAAYQARRVLLRRLRLTDPHTARLWGLEVVTRGARRCYGGPYYVPADLARYEVFRARPSCHPEVVRRERASAG